MRYLKYILIVAVVIGLVTAIGKYYFAPQTKGKISVVFDEADKPGESLQIIFRNDKGSIVKTLAGKDLNLPDEFLYDVKPVWSKNNLWFPAGPTAFVEAVIKIDSNTFQITKFDLSDVYITKSEFDLNPTKERIVFSNFPAIFDADSVEEFRASKKTVTLFVYDLNNKSKEAIATSITKEFHPKWIDENTLEYDKPSGEGRVTKAIP